MVGQRNDSTTPAQRQFRAIARGQQARTYGACLPKQHAANGPLGMQAGMQAQNMRMTWSTLHQRTPACTTTVISHGLTLPYVLSLACGLQPELTHAALKVSAFKWLQLGVDGILYAHAILSVLAQVAYLASNPGHLESRPHATADE